MTVESIRLEKASKITESKYCPALPSPPLKHVPKCHIYTRFKYLQGWWLNPFPRQPVPMLDLPYGGEIFFKIQSKTPLVQLEAISSCHIACLLGEETNPHLAIISFQGVVESDKGPSWAFFSPGWMPPAPSATSHRACAPDPSPALLPFSGPTPAFHVLLILPFMSQN